MRDCLESGTSLATIGSRAYGEAGKLMVAVHLGILGTPSKKCRLDASADPIQELRNACQGVIKGPMLISATFPENFLWRDRPRPDSKSTPYGTEDIEWSCSASLFEEFKLGSTDVICEGYASSDDPSRMY